MLSETNDLRETLKNKGIGKCATIRRGRSENVAKLPITCDLNGSYKPYIQKRCANWVVNKEIEAESVGSEAINGINR